MGPEDALKQYEMKINLHRFETLVPLIASNAIFWFSDGSHEGLDAIQRAFEQTWLKIANEHYWLEDLIWLGRGNGCASCIYRFCWKGLWDGKVSAGQGRGTTVLTQVGDGWKIIHEHLSHFPRP